MSRPPGSNRVLDLQSLKQAAASVARAIELFVNGKDNEDREAIAQAELAERFLEEFVDNRRAAKTKRKIKT